MATEELARNRRLLLRKPVGLGMPVCVTWCQSESAEQVAASFGADLSTATPSTLDEATAYRHGGDGPSVKVLLVGRLGDWTLAVEPNGFEGTEPRVLRALTRGGRRAFTAFWNVNMDNEVAYAVDGKVAGSFDMLDVEGMWGDAPDLIREHMMGLAFTEEVAEQDLKAGALLIGERVTGQPITEAWLEAEHVRYVIAERAPESPITEEIRNHEVVLADPELREIVDDPTPARLRDIARVCAKTVARAVQLRAPAVAEALAALDRRPDEQVVERLRGDLEGLRRRLDARGFAEQARSGDAPGSPGWLLFRQSRATSVLVEALADDPLKAAREATWIAGSVGWPDDGTLRVGVLSLCVRHIEMMMRR